MIYILFHILLLIYFLFHFVFDFIILYYFCFCPVTHFNIVLFFFFFEHLILLVRYVTRWKRKKKNTIWLIKFAVPVKLAKFAFISMQKLILRERYSICQNCTFSLASTGAMSYLFDICNIPVWTFYVTLCIIRYYRDPIHLDIWLGESMRLTWMHSVFYSIIHKGVRANFVFDLYLLLHSETFWYFIVTCNSC